MNLAQRNAVQTLDATSARAEVEALCGVLIDCVDGGASVGFMAPMTPAKARTFWARVAEGVATAERVLFVARDGEGRINGTVQLVLAQMENQPHRAEISKLLVHRQARRQGVGEALMKAAESHALALRRTVLVLDTATPEAERLYRRQGWQLCGHIPDYALLPGGGLCATAFFYKLISPAL